MRLRVSDTLILPNDDYKEYKDKVCKALILPNTIYLCPACGQASSALHAAAVGCTRTGLGLD